jgi:murein DD-endopeptidase MepM/ murein hydrolase activator NlpD
MRARRRCCLCAVVVAMLTLTLMSTSSLATTAWEAADTGSELAASLRAQHSLAIRLNAAREWLERLEADVTRVLDGDRSDEEALRTLVRRDPALLAQLAKARGLVKSLSARKREADRMVRLLATAPFGVCPVDESRHFVDDFGLARWGHRHQGIDIHAPSGTPIRAPFDGRAEDASNSVGGLAVNVLGADGFVYNAHLSRLGGLGRVREGDVIGYVGASGNASGTSPHDHFEWHPHGGSAIDPYKFLTLVCAPPSGP